LAWWRLKPVPTKPFSWAAKSARNESRLINAAINQRGSIMLATILNAIYREFLKSSVSGMLSLELHPKATTLHIAGPPSLVPPPRSHR
jgi:hypothetical protein